MKRPLETMPGTTVWGTSPPPSLLVEYVPDKGYVVTLHWVNPDPLVEGGGNHRYIQAILYADHYPHLKDFAKTQQDPYFVLAEMTRVALLDLEGAIL